MPKNHLAQRESCPKILKSGLTLTDDPDFIADEIEKHYNKVGKLHTFALGREEES